MGVHSVQAGEDHGLDFLETGQRFKGGTIVVGDGVSNLSIANILEVGEKEADLSCFKGLDFDRLRREHSKILHLGDGAIRPETNFLPAPNSAVKDAGQYDHSAIRIKPGVEDESLQRAIGRSLGRRNTLNDGLQDVGYTFARFGADLE